MRNSQLFENVSDRECGDQARYEEREEGTTQCLKSIDSGEFPLSDAGCESWLTGVDFLFFDPRSRIN